MTRPPRLAFAFGLVGLLSVATPVAAQPAPSGAHPRLWLNAATRSALKTQASDAASPLARAAKRCSAARTDPASYADGGWQGFEFTTTLSSCLVSWAASGGADDLGTAIKYWNVLLDDYQQVGDGAGGDSVVTHDTGYAMRTFAPYSALAYDWLHDAPGVSEALRAHARARFAAWTSYYATGGYLKDLAGANYQAGYGFAATLMAIAEAGEAGSTGDQHWANVRDAIWQKTLEPAFGAGGLLEGGDWPEGWQYGPLGVLEHALGARALADNGVSLPNAAAWASSLPLRFAYELTPVTRQTFAAGDTDDPAPNRQPDNGALLGALLGPASVQAKSWARQLNAELGLQNDNPLFDALAAAESGPSASLPASSPTSYLAPGTGHWFVRGSWADDTVWSTFECSRQLVPDHEHADAGNWVLTRGADDLVVDPSPYGSLSTLTGNAPAVDSASLPSGYSPSQGYWGVKTALVWARQASSGVAAARCDYADQFRLDDVASDVAHALRDFVLVPSDNGGTVVLVDRVVTGAAGRGLHLRVRTPAALVLSGKRATAALGASSLAIDELWSSSGQPNVRSMPQASECPSSDHGCDVSRLTAGSEYRVDVSGPSALAIHVVDAQASGAPASSASLLVGSGYRGALVTRGSARFAVLSNDAADGALGASLSYRVPAGGDAVHVVLDAPVDGSGMSDVSASSDAAGCAVSVRPHTGGAGGFSGRPLVVRVSASCAVSEDRAVPPMDPGSGGAAGSGAAGSGTAGGGSPGGAGGSGDSNGGSGAAGAPGGSGGFAGSSVAAGGARVNAPSGARPGTPGCSFSAGSPDSPAALLGAGLLGLWLLSRRQRSLAAAPARRRSCAAYRCRAGAESCRGTRP